MKPWVQSLVLEWEEGREKDAEAGREEGRREGERKINLYDGVC
jgi:hypothetical protein